MEKTYTACQETAATSQPPEQKSKAFYLDDKHNIVPEDKATTRVIQVLDEKGNMIEEVWQTRKPPETEKPEEPEPYFVTRYVDKEGNVVDKSVATHLAFDKYVNGKLVDSSKYPLAKNEGFMADIHGCLELKHQPSKAERVQMLIVEEFIVKLELPAYVSITPKEYVVKNKGRMDYATGKHGDARIMVSCKSIFYRWNTLGHILLNLLLLLITIVYALCLLLKQLVTSKWFLLVLSAAGLIFGCLYFKLI